MNKKLTVSIDQYSNAGQKNINQDFHGAYLPEGLLLENKGIAVAIADGISSSDVSQIASEAAISSFLADYYSTSDAWSVKASAQKVLLATNSWLYSQTRNSPHRFDKDKGYICTFSGLIIKSRTAHIFHCGDTRIYRLSGNSLEQLTTDHQHHISTKTSYLTRALGIHDYLELEYVTFPVNENDVFILSSDGVHDHLSNNEIAVRLKEATNKETIDDFNGLAESIAQQAINAGSEDNVTLQMVRVDQLPEPRVDEVHQQLESLPLPPTLHPRSIFEGYRILREIYISSRSHVYLAEDLDSNEQVVIKTPSTELKDDALYLERFLMEDWIAKRIKNFHVLKAIPAKEKRNYLYIVTEYIEGKTLAQWMRDNPKPDIETVRNIIEQIAKGIQAFHRQEMIHQDLRPNNIMIDPSGTVKIIDFGSTKVAGLTDIQPINDGIVGTMQYSAPEYFVQGNITAKADIYSMGVMAYEMLSGQLPYGINVCNATTTKAQQKLCYHPLTSQISSVPEWFDDAIKKAVSINPLKRYYETSELVQDLRYPNKTFISKQSLPLINRNPFAFWKGLSFLLFLIILWMAFNQ